MKKKAVRFNSKFKSILVILVLLAADIDFGNRSNTVLAAQYAQIAANLNQNNAFQQVILEVQESYYEVLGQQALVSANQLSLKQAKTSLDVAQALRENGLATIGDVYQAE